MIKTGGLILVDGAAGYLGKRLVKELAKAGLKVRATDLPSSDLSYAEELGLEVVKADLLNREQLERAVDGVGYVVHCAALFDLHAEMEVLRRVNVTGTQNLIKVLAGKDIKQFIHVSSSDIYGDLKYLPGDENHPPHCRNDYAVSKKEGEDIVWRYAKELNIPVTVVRPSAVYGPGSIYIAGVFFFWPIFFRLLGFRKVPYMRGGSKLTFAHIDDVVGAIQFLIGRSDSIGEAYNVADPEVMFSANFASKLCECFGMKRLFSFTIPIPHLLLDLYAKFMLAFSGPFLRIANRFVKKRWLKLREKYDLDKRFTPHFEREFYSYFIGHRYYSNKKLVDLGYKFKSRSFYEGFPATLKWYVDNEWLPPISSEYRIKN